MGLEWIAVVVSVALVLNGSLFFISGGYGPLRLCFLCLAAIYSQRLKYGRTAVLPVVEHMNDHGDGYQLVQNPIFTQPMTRDSSTDTIQLNIRLSAGSMDQSLI